MIQWGVAGYTAVSLAGVFVLFSKKKKYTALKAGFVLLNVFLLLPYAGHVLNGLSYVSNRWIWAYGMLIAYIFVKIYPELFALTLTEKRKVFVMLLIYCILAAPPEAARTQPKSDGDGPFVTFDIYRAFLRKYLYQGAKSYGDGCRFPDRRHPV